MAGQPSVVPAISAPEVAARVFYVVNQDVCDGSAHALYCFRNCWWLAKTRPETQVQILFPGSIATSAVFNYFGFQPLPNLKLVGLPAVRERSCGVRLTINPVYYWSVYFYLCSQSRAGDLLVSASFPKLFAFLLRRKALRKLRTVYEVHQLVHLDEPENHSKTKVETDMLARVDCLLTTTAALAEKLQTQFPTKAIRDLKLACTFTGGDISPPRYWTQPGKPACFTVGYLGSVYHPQGVEWLIEHWPRIQLAQSCPVQLHIIGGNPRDLTRLRKTIRSSGAANIFIRGAVQASQIPTLLEEVDALVIPALPEGRMPYVALTKAYDYLGLKRPVLASNLAPIAEVMRDGREAVLFEAGNPVSLADTLDVLISDIDLQKQLVANAVVRSREFTWSHRALRWWEHVLPLSSTSQPLTATEKSPDTAAAIYAHS